MDEISSARRRELRAEAHHLNPVVSVADKGLTPAVLAEIDRALTIHGLIKVRTYGQDRTIRANLMEDICRATGAAPVQLIGNLLVLWREKPAEAVEEKPARTRPVRPAKRLSDVARAVVSARKAPKARPARPAPNRAGTASYAPRRGRSTSR